jgi:hypothetical protein
VLTPQRRVVGNEIRPVAVLEGGLRGEDEHVSPRLGGPLAGQVDSEPGELLGATFEAGAAQRERGNPERRGGQRVGTRERIVAMQASNLIRGLEERPDTPQLPGRRDAPADQLASRRPVENPRRAGEPGDHLIARHRFSGISRPHPPPAQRSWTCASECRQPFNSHPGR